MWCKPLFQKKKNFSSRLKKNQKKIKTIYTCVYMVNFILYSLLYIYSYLYYIVIFIYSIYYF